MKLLVLTICFACLPTFGQQSFTFGQFLREQDQLRQSRQIAAAIDEHRPFSLPDNRLWLAEAKATAAGIKDDGTVLTLTGVEIKTSNLSVTADEVIYDWASRQIELRGNVLLNPVWPQQ